MYIIFKDKDLKKYANDDSKLLRKFGKVRAEKINLRLSQLKAALSLEDVRYLAGNWHELTKNRKGQWACDLDQPYRLIFEPQESPIPEGDDGKYVWSEIKGVSILEIVDYH